MRGEIIHRQFFARKNFLAIGKKDDYRQHYANRETFPECGKSAAQSRCNRVRGAKRV
jgi:hypothetical protein